MMDFSEYYKNKERINRLKDGLENKSLDELQSVIESTEDDEIRSYAIPEWEVRTGMLWSEFIEIPVEYLNLTKKKKPLPALDAIYGNGLKLHGFTDWRHDGSFISTAWFIMFYVPIFPIRSIRVLKMTFMDNQEKSRFIKYVDVPLCKKQVLKYYIPLTVIILIILTLNSIF